MSTKPSMSAEWLEEHGIEEHEEEAFYAYADDYLSEERDDAAETFHDAFQGAGYDSGADFAEQLAADMGATSPDHKWPLTHIDWEAAWTELETGDGFAFIDGYVFRAV